MTWPAILERDLTFALLPGAMLYRLFTCHLQLSQFMRREPSAIAPIVHECGAQQRHTLQR